jgi:hypothetical protein
MYTAPKDFVAHQLVVGLRNEEKQFGFDAILDSERREPALFAREVYIVTGAQREQVCVNP